MRIKNSRPNLFQGGEELIWLGSDWNLVISCYLIKVCRGRSGANHIRVVTTIRDPPAFVIKANAGPSTWREKDGTTGGKRFIDLPSHCKPLCDNKLRNFLSVFVSQQRE